MKNLLNQLEVLIDAMRQMINECDDNINDEQFKQFDKLINEIFSIHEKIVSLVY